MSDLLTALREHTAFERGTVVAAALCGTNAVLDDAIAEYEAALVTACLQEAARRTREMGTYALVTARFSEQRARADGLCDAAAYLDQMAKESADARS